MQILHELSHGNVDDFVLLAAAAMVGFGTMVAGGKNYYLVC